MSYKSLAQDDTDAHSDLETTEPAPDNHHPSSDCIPLSPATDTSRHHALSETDEPVITRSREGSIPMRHPTPDLQSLQGAYVSNVERLEQSAERLSLTSDIGEEIRKKLEQRRSSSRRSSLANSPLERDEYTASVQHQLPYGQGTHHSNSIIGTNNVARNGGFSPAAYFPSPRGSMHSGSWSQHNSVKSRTASQGLRLTQISEPALEGRPLDSPLQTRSSSIPSTPLSPRHPLGNVLQSSHDLNDIEIPHTRTSEHEELLPGLIEKRSASNDTTRQQDALFSDFDGTHTQAQLPSPTSSPKHHQASRRASQMLQEEDQPPGGMVYYPAPVPVMLNMPQKLSKQRHTRIPDRMHMETFGDLFEPGRRSTMMQPQSAADKLEQRETSSVKDEDPLSQSHHKYRSMANLPPQLRASVFFDHPKTRHDVEIREESAVATLDSILDASAFAPVTAFTDHPIAGKLGTEVYGRHVFPPQGKRVSTDPSSGRKRESSMNKLTKRNSSSDLLDSGRPRRSSVLSLGNFGKRKSSAQAMEDLQDQTEEVANATPVVDHAAGYDEHMPSDELGDFEQYNENLPDASDELEEEAVRYDGAPTTLLAELQMRKQELKKRTRAAATAFPDGMHSTLLELEAVAQVEKQARRKKQTLLAWEDPNAHVKPEDDDDDDVPLGVLQHRKDFKSRRFDEHRPLGLIEMRDMEDNEPLSHRRARLRGEDPMRTSTFNNQASAQFPASPNLPPNVGTDREDTDEDDDHPRETLGERMRRLRATQIPTNPDPVSDDFASEMLSQLGGMSGTRNPPVKQPNLKANSRVGPDNIQQAPGNDDGEEETLGQRRRRLQAASAGVQRSGTQPARDMDGPLPSASHRPFLDSRRSMADILQVHPVAGGGLRRVSNDVAYAPAPGNRTTAWATRVNQQAASGIAPYANGQFAVGAGAIPGSFPGTDARQMDMVDRWRQSVM